LGASPALGIPPDPVGAYKRVYGLNSYFGVFPKSQKEMDFSLQDDSVVLNSRNESLNIANSEKLRLSQVIML
jgi:hypothetical protein